MSETETQPRNEAGQFTPSTDGLYGRELANAESGFTTKKDPPAEEKTYSDDLDGVKEAARDLADKRGPARLRSTSTSFASILASRTSQKRSRSSRPPRS
jgi:hypothetical protein